MEVSLKCLHVLRLLLSLKLGLWLGDSLFLIERDVAFPVSVRSAGEVSSTSVRVCSHGTLYWILGRFSSTRKGFLQEGYLLLGAGLAQLENYFFLPPTRSVSLHLAKLKVIKEARELQEKK